MVHIKTKKGLNIPISCAPKGAPKELVPNGEASFKPELVALDLTGFDGVKFKLLVDLEESVKRGQPLAEDRSFPGRFFVSPAGGKIHEIRRGLKRRLLYIVIQLSEQEEVQKNPPLDLENTSKESLIENLKKNGLFTRIWQRPFNSLADPNKTPKSIFIKAVETAPFMPPPELFLENYKKEFQIGIDALNKLAEKNVHLVYSKESAFVAFREAKNAIKHTVEGPHPVCSPSLHIETISPILSVQDVIWTLDARTVAMIGYLIQHGEYLVSKIIGIGGPGIVEGKTGFFNVREGFPIEGLIAGRIKNEPVRLISGTPLTGHAVQAEDFLGFNDAVFCVIPENRKREFLHFFGAGASKFSMSGAYLSGHLDNSKREYDFTTNQHGERRAFIDSTLYDDVMPLDLSTMHLIKAILAEDYELAEALGLLTVSSEDFALPAFVCPSKIDMPAIVKAGLKKFASENI